MLDYRAQKETASEAPDYLSGAFEYYQQIILSMLDLVITARLPDLELEYQNSAVQAFLGPADSSNTRLTLLDLIAQEDHENFIQQFAQSPYVPKYLGTLNLRFRKAGMEPHWLACFGSIVTASDHHPRLVLLLRDIDAIKSSQNEIRRISRALSATKACSLDLVRATDEQNLIESICKNIVEVGGYRLAWVGYLQPDARQTLKPVAQAGYDAGYLDLLNIALNDPERRVGPSGQALLRGEIHICHDMLADPNFAIWRDAAIQRGYRSSISIPLKHIDSPLIGSVNIYASEANVFDLEEVGILNQMASDLAYGIFALRTAEANKRTTRELEASLSRLHQVMNQTVASLATIVEIRDPYTAGHQQKVTNLAVAIGRMMKLDEDRLEAIYIASSLHDIGKISVPTDILIKPGQISEIEQLIIRNHSRTGYDIIKNIPFEWPIADIVLQHHERYNGSGYPLGLKGEEILLEARIICVADVVEAMAADRPYRAALGLECAVNEITVFRGQYYDPVVVDACLDLIAQYGEQILDLSH